MELDAYVMESMGYVTAGILDSVVHPDAAVESAIVKVCELWIYIAYVASSYRKWAFSNYLIPWQELPHDTVMLVTVNNFTNVTHIWNVVLACCFYQWCSY